MTRETILTGFAMLEAAGIRKPDAWHAPTDEEAAARLLSAADLWAVVLEEVSDADFSAALLARIRQGEPFWPTIGQLLALVPARRIAAAEAADDADEAWGAVLALARRVGRAAGLPENRAKWDSKGTEYGARLWIGINACGGWDAICNADDKGHGFMRPAFLAAYRSAKARRAIVADTANVVRLADHVGNRKAIAGGGGGFKRIGEP